MVEQPHLLDWNIVSLQDCLAPSREAGFNPDPPSDYGIDVNPPHWAQAQIVLWALGVGLPSSVCSQWPTAVNGRALFLSGPPGALSPSLSLPLPPPFWSTLEGAPCGFPRGLPWVPRGRLPNVRSVAVLWGWSLEVWGGLAPLPLSLPFQLSAT